jgi:hypothetical protein
VVEGKGSDSPPASVVVRLVEAICFLAAMTTALLVVFVISVVFLAFYVRKLTGARGPLAPEDSEGHAWYAAPSSRVMLA